MRISGSIVADGTTIQLNQGGNSTTISAGSPAGDVTITLPATTSTLATVGGTETLTGKTIDGDDNTVQDLPLTAIKTVLADADKVLVRDASGVPTSALIVNANIDTSAAIAVTKLAAVTASRVLVSDGDGKLSASSVTATTLGYLDATSSIQTQINSKQATITGAATSIDDVDLVANKVLVSDASGKVAASSVSDTTLSYLDATSSVQTQIDGKQAADSDLTALANLSSTGVVARTGSGTAAVRTITGTTNKITVTDGDGVSGNPTLNIGSDVVTITGVQTLSQKRLDSPQLEEVTVLPRDFTTGDSPFIRFKSGDISSNHVQLEGPTSLASSYAVILPTTAPSTGQNLKAGTSGQLEWGGVEGGNSAGDIVTTDDTQTLTNKTVTSASLGSPTISDYALLTETTAPSSPAAGKLAVYAKSDHKLWIKNSDGIESQAGSGGGGAGSVNYIQSSSKSWDFETDTTGWNVFRDGSAVEDGTGGSPTVTVARNTTTPLNGTADLKITKPSGNQQWSGASIDVEVPRAYQLGAKCEVSFLYDFSAQTAAGDWQFYIYDVDNATLITPANNDIPKAVGRIATSWDCTTSANYRLIIACVDSDTAGYDVYVDDVVMGPGKVVNGFASWDNQTVTVTGSWITTATYTAKETRRGSWAHYEIVVSLSGAATNTPLTVNLPSGRTVDNSALAYADTNNMVLGTCAILCAGTNYMGEVAYHTTTAVRTWIYGVGGTYISGANNMNASTPGVFNAGSSVVLRFSVPIAEWAGGSAYLGTSDAQEIVIAYNSANDAGAALATFNTVEFNTEVVDTANCFASNAFTARTAGYFEIDASVHLFSGTSMSRGILAVFVNGIEETRLTDYPYSVGSGTDVVLSGSTTLKLAAGDVVTIRVYVAGVGTYTICGGASAHDTRMSVKRVSVDGHVIGFGAATSTSMGLVKGGTVPGQVSGANVAAGYIGETQNSTSTTLFTTTPANIFTLSLTAGIWLVTTHSTAYSNAGSTTGYRLSISNTSVTDHADYYVTCHLSSATDKLGGTSISRVLNLSSTTPIYIVGTATGASINQSQKTVVTAVRIA